MAFSDSWRSLSDRIVLWWIAFEADERTYNSEHFHFAHHPVSRLEIDAQERPEPAAVTSLNIKAAFARGMICFLTIGGIATDACGF